MFERTGRRNRRDMGLSFKFIFQRGDISGESMTIGRRLTAHIFIWLDWDGVSIQLDSFHMVAHCLIELSVKPAYNLHYHSTICYLMSSLQDLARLGLHNADLPACRSRSCFAE